MQNSKAFKETNCIVLFKDGKTIVAKEYSSYEWCFQIKIIKKNQRIRKIVLFIAFNPYKHKILRNTFKPKKGEYTASSWNLFQKV